MPDTSPKTIAFNNESNNRDHNIYTEEFFGGADVFIYINDELYEDISAVQFSVSENVKPIYGYSSRRYDDLAIGTRIVQGVIKVPVRNTNPNKYITNDYKDIRNKKLVNTKSTNVPNWVYKYTTDKDTLGSSNVVPQYNDVKSSTIADVQHRLGVEVTGTNDLETQKAVAEYKKANSLEVNSNIDIVLLNRLDLSGKNVKITTGITNLRYKPTEESPSYFTIQPKNKVVILKDLNDEWYYVQINEGTTGYIKKSEVI
jgi:hypothetical protein